MLDPIYADVEVMQSFLGALLAAVPILSRAVPAITRVAATVGRAATRAISSPVGRTTARVVTNPGVQAAAGTAAVFGLQDAFEGPPTPTNIAAGNFGWPATSIPPSALVPPTGPGALVQPGSFPTSPHLMAPILEPMFETRIKCPKGYVAVTDPQSGGRACMLKPLARAYGLWKPRRKPPISASDWRTLQVAERVQKKVARITKRYGPKPRRRTR